MPLMHDEQMDSWDPAFFLKSPAFWPLELFAKHFVDLEAWPSLEDFNRFSSRDGEQNAPKFIEQNGKQKVIDYIKQIAFASEVPSRENNWHDYLNMLCWQAFPKSRKKINALQIEALAFQPDSERGLVRSAHLDVLTHLDECGVAVVSSSKVLLDGIRNFAWKDVFLRYRDVFATSVDVVIFGHGLYVQCLAPFIGMTGRCLLLECDGDHFEQSKRQRLERTDSLVTNALGSVKTPQDLAPLPLLGIPGWHEENENSHFYENRDYFRPGRQKDA
jgi:hypothetical protein